MISATKKETPYFATRQVNWPNQVTYMLRETKQLFLDQQLNNADTMHGKLLDFWIRIAPPFQLHQMMVTLWKPVQLKQTSLDNFSTLVSIITSHHWGVKILTATYSSLFSSNCPVEFLCTVELVLDLPLPLNPPSVMGSHQRCWNLTHYPTIHPLNLYWHHSYCMEVGSNYSNFQRYEQFAAIRLQINLHPPSCKQTHWMSCQSNYQRLSATTCFNFSKAMGFHVQPFHSVSPG